MESGKVVRPHENVSRMSTPSSSEKSALDERRSAEPMARRDRSLLKFFLLVFALSAPFWLVGIVTDLQLIPGLPLSALTFVCPLVAAVILVHGENGSEGVKELLKRAFDYKRIGARVWYIPIVLLMPGVTVLAYGLMRLMGAPLPIPQFPFLAALVMLLVFFIAAICEELGWSGYVIDRMQNRWNALQAGILLGLVWATWHIVPLVQAHRSAEWIAWWCLNTVALRVLTVWLYNNTGKSVFATILFHTFCNVSWLMFPNYGSHWDPRIVGLITALAAVIVALVWGPGTLSRHRNA